MTKHVPYTGHDKALTWAAAYHNAYKTAAPWARATGFRTQALRFRALSQNPDSRLAEEFLVNTRMLRGDRESEHSVGAYFSDASVVMLALDAHEDIYSGQKLDLPADAPLQVPLGEVLAHRRSTRIYTGDPIELDCLATLIRAAAGITAYTDVQLAEGGTARLHLRTGPSAGGLYPIDLYVAVLNVNGVGRAIYRYNSVSDTLVRVGEQSEVDSLMRSFAVPENLISLTRANAVFLLVGRPWKAIRKYGNRGMRFVFQEAGSMSQNVHLVAVGLGLGSVDCASVYEDEAHAVLKFDGVFKALIHSVIIGYPA